MGYSGASISGKWNSNTHACVLLLLNTHVSVLLLLNTHGCVGEEDRLRNNKLSIKRQNKLEKEWEMRAEITEIVRDSQEGQTIDNFQRKGKIAG